MIRMEISLSGVKELEGNLNRIKNVVDSFEPELKDIGEWYIDFLTNDVFLTDGAIIGEDWADVNPSYKESKSKKYPGRGTLEASGFMRTHWKLYTSAHYALIENEADYAKYHQHGQGVPQRMFVKFTNDVQNTIYEMFEEGVLKRIQNAFR